MTSLSSGALLSAQQPTEALRCPDHSLVRNSLRTCTLASGHSLLRAARLRHSVANINATHGRSHRRGTDALAATTQQSSAVMTPILQLQKRLQDSGAVLDALDLSYKQSVAARKVRQGEVAATVFLNMQHTWFNRARPTKQSLLQVLLSIPGDVAVTKEDVAAEPACAQLASGRSEVVGLALWLIVQRCKVLVRSLSQVCSCFTCHDINDSISDKSSCNVDCLVCVCISCHWQNPSKLTTGVHLTMEGLCRHPAANNQLPNLVATRGAVRVSSGLTSSSRGSGQIYSVGCRMGQCQPTNGCRSVTTS